VTATPAPSPTPYPLDVILNAILGRIPAEPGMDRNDDGVLDIGDLLLPILGG
jgi:hypothetical protein